MPPFGPISRRALIDALRRAGFAGPYAGGKHEFMIRDRWHIILPNPHGGDIERAFLARILKQAGMSRDQWEAL